MNKKNRIFFFLVLFLFTSCSFDNKTGLWKGAKEEKKRISELEKRQNEILNIDKVYTADDVFSLEKPLTKKIVLSKPRENLSWLMNGKHYQNFLGNIYLSGINEVFLKKKIGKNKFALSGVIASPLIINNNIIFSDDRGTIYNISDKGNINWKKNIYKKIYKKIYKNLIFAIYQNNIYVADNIGFIYAISLSSGKLVWIKNHGIPLKSNIKIFDNKIFLINQDNRIFCLSTKDGTKIWDIRSISSFIISQNFLSLAVSKIGDVIVLNSSGDLFKAKGSDGDVHWSLNT